MAVLAHRSLGQVREQTVQKEEGEQVCGGPELFTPIKCRIHLRRLEQYKLQILKSGAEHYISRDRLDLASQFYFIKRPKQRRKLPSDYGNNYLKGIQPADQDNAIHQQRLTKSLSISSAAAAAAAPESFQYLSPPQDIPRPSSPY